MSTIRDDRKDGDDRDPVSRRTFLGTSGVLAVASALPAGAARAVPVEEGVALQREVPRTRIQVTVNGLSYQVAVEDRWTLVELLRDDLDLTGTKVGCDRGECGACTDLMDDQPVYACS